MLGGCARKFTGLASAPQEPEQVLFKAVSGFYCAYKRWPESLHELASPPLLAPSVAASIAPLEVSSAAPATTAFLAPEAVSYFASPVVSSTRPVVFSIEYLPTSVGIKELSRPPATAPSIPTPTVAAARRKATFIAPPSCKNSKEHVEVDGRISLVAGRLSFILAPSFAPFTGATIREKWGNGTVPDVAWNDPEAGVTVAVRFGEALLSDASLEGFKSGLEVAYAKSVPGLVWHRKESSLASTPKLLIHEFDSSSSRGTLKSIVFSLPFDGRLLSISVTASVERERAVNQTATVIRDSLLVK